VLIVAFSSDIPSEHQGWSLVTSFPLGWTLSVVKNLAETSRHEKEFWKASRFQTEIYQNYCGKAR